MMQVIRAETRGFGRDLAASADAMRQSHDALGVEELVRLTGEMLNRVQSTEAKLEAATNEASELRAKLEEARDNARRDPLTDLPNRRAFEEAFAARAADGASLCVAVCDVDRFKRVNDRFGHAVGDRVLKAIGDALLGACSGHLVARYGGEEFAVLFCGVERGAALATLEIARETVASKRYRLRDSDEPLGAVTFSAGFTQAAPGEQLGTVFGRADRLLYAAKHAGRNSIGAG
jgi:diguanylate cyclase